MKSKASSKFWKAYHNLPIAIQIIAVKKQALAEKSLAPIPSV
jgi:hypothetical protein